MRIAILVSLVAAALLAIPAAGLGASTTTVPYKKYGTLSHSYTIPSHPPGTPVPAGILKFHFQGTFPQLKNKEWIGYFAFYEGTINNCYGYATAGDLGQGQRKLKNPTMQPIAAFVNDPNYRPSNWCHGKWYGYADVYKENKNGTGHAVERITPILDFKITKG